MRAVKLEIALIDNSWSFAVKERERENVVAERCGIMRFFSPLKWEVLQHVCIFLEMAR